MTRLTHAPVWFNRCHVPLRLSGTSALQRPFHNAGTVDLHPLRARQIHVSQKE